MQMSVYDVNGKAVQQVDLPDEIFSANINVGLMHQAYIRQTANRRRGSHSALTRREVSRTGKKVYRQKGTGNARHGDRGAPIFVGGGRAHPPKPRDYEKKMPQKMSRAAIRSALSALVRDNQLVLVDDLTRVEAKTRAVAKVLHNVAGSENALVILPGSEKGSNVYRAARNLPEVTVLNAQYLNIRDLLNHEKVIIALSALEVIYGIWGKKES
ncbi:MAG: 50S ribosomal protein L4 [Phototrophicaceae bacterium]